MVTSTSMPGSIESCVICRTVSVGDWRSITLLWMRIWKRSHVLEPSPRRLASRDAKRLGRHAHRPLDLELLVLGGLDELVRDALNCAAVFGGDGDADFVHLLLVLLQIFLSFLVA